jgi:isoleucyl-tRNA synthetase
VLRVANRGFSYSEPVQGFEPLPAQVDLPALEREVLARWQAAGVFERSLKQTEGGPAWIFYEGPPTANGMPGVHHVEARTFKDLFPRFKTMQGFHVPRKGGWDCHGLPVEVAVEKELGFTGKRDIEAYGVAEFNARCRESVLRHVDAWLEMSRRMGYWADTEHAYRTMDASYVESVWWSLKVVYDAGLLVRDFRISPYCPRCGTPLSDAELGQPDVYRAVRDPAITVRFRLRALPEGAPAALEGADMLVWTTTPCTCWPGDRGTATGWSSRTTCSPRCSVTAGTSPPGSAVKRWSGQVTSVRSASFKFLTPMSWFQGRS